ncbi:hypothetical protein [Chromobacterium rhizoryzae]|uniref:hypothetical protein n=1 Tax=Chromobacterium rhizoryzae TaxID=1778675 RepID=UPI001D0611E7|nr:hypothetical protein [Chromobacterium rhizoryzae]
MAEIGKSISECISFLSKVGTECELLARLLKQELSNLLTDGSVSKCVVADAWIESTETDSSNWVFTGIAHSLPIIIKPKRTVGAYLFFQISFIGDGIAAVGNEQPLLHVGFWSEPVDFDENWMGFPLDESALVDMTLEQDLLFRWSTPGVRESQWTYSLRLAEINTMEDIQQKIIVPVRELLRGQSASDAFSYAVHSIVRYGEIDGDPGHYRVLQ